VENGEDPMDAISAATSINARILGWEEDIGSLESGKYADVIAVPGNPLDDVTTMERVFWVMKGGVVHRSEVEG
jgi:imidazolonepropionase-like amidohydrolase